ncbi:MAG: thioesterase [Spirochaetales bacterium]|nr:thioesterase [Spirochaetales bacterium]
MYYSQSFKIRNSECDPTLSLSPAAVLDYFQEAAGRQCIPYGMGVPEIFDTYGMTWVLSGMSVCFDSYPSWPDEIVVETWPRTLKGFKAFRDFLMKDETGKILARGSSVWALLNLETRRPAKMDFVGDIMPHDPDRHAIENPVLGRIPAADRFNQDDVVFSVTPSDLDYNQHVNNIRYLIWLLTYLDADFTSRRKLSELNIAFTGESTLGDDICLKSMLDENRGMHSFVRVQDGRDVCRMTTEWRNC